jgi:hypothetical protein
MVCAPDGIRQPACSVFAGISWNDSGPVRESSRKLQIGAVVELPQSLEAELDDPLGAQLAALAMCGLFDSGDEGLESAGIEVPLVSRADQRAEELVAVEGLAVAIALDHHGRLRDRALEGREAVAALRALAAAAKGGAAIGVARL